MSTRLKRLFQLDFDPMINDEKIISLNGENEDGTITSVDIVQNVRQDLITSTRLITYYIPAVGDTTGLVTFILSNLGSHVQKPEEEVVGSFINDVQVGKHNVIFSSRIYVYSEVELTESEVSSLEELCIQLNVFLTLRSRSYVDKRVEIEKDQN